MYARMPAGAGQSDLYEDSRHRSSQPQLCLNNRGRQITVKRRDLPIYYMENVTTWRVYLFPRRGKCPRRRHQIAFMRAVQR